MASAHSFLLEQYVDYLQCFWMVLQSKILPANSDETIPSQMISQDKERTLILSRMLWANIRMVVHTHFRIFAFWPASSKLEYLVLSTSQYFNDVPIFVDEPLFSMARQRFYGSRRGNCSRSTSNRLYMLTSSHDALSTWHWFQPKKILSKENHWQIFHFSKGQFIPGACASRPSIHFRGLSWGAANAAYIPHGRSSWKIACDSRAFELRRYCDSYPSLYGLTLVERTHLVEIVLADEFCVHVRAGMHHRVYIE